MTAASLAEYEYEYAGDGVVSPSRHRPAEVRN